MKNVIMGLVTCLLMLSGFAQAENVTFTGALANTCTISNVTSGSLTIDGTSVSTDSLATATVVNNAGSAFSLDFTAPSTWDSAPNAYTGTTTFNGGFTLAGDNAVSELQTGLTLANPGTDTASIQIFGTSDTTYAAGNYAATAVISCNAL